MCFPMNHRESELACTRDPVFTNLVFVTLNFLGVLILQILVVAVTMSNTFVAWWFPYVLALGAITSNFFCGG